MIEITGKRNAARQSSKRPERQTDREARGLSPLGSSASARLLRLLRARLAALAGSALPGKRPARWVASGARAGRLLSRRFPLNFPRSSTTQATTRRTSASGRRTRAWRGSRRRVGGRTPHSFLLCAFFLSFPLFSCLSYRPPVPDRCAMPEALTSVQPPSNWVNWTRHTPTKPGTSASSAAFVSKLDGIVPGPLPHKAPSSTPATQVCRRRRQPPDCPRPASLRARRAPQNPGAPSQAPPRSTAQAPPRSTAHRPPPITHRACPGAESEDEARIGPHVALGRERRAARAARRAGHPAARVLHLERLLHLRRHLGWSRAHGRRDADADADADAGASADVDGLKRAPEVLTPRLVERPVPHAALEPRRPPARRLLRRRLLALSARCSVCAPARPLLARRLLAHRLLARHLLGRRLLGRGAEPDLDDRAD